MRATLGSPADNAIGWGGVWLSTVLGGTVAVLFPGGLKGRGALAFTLVARAGSIRAGGAESADIPRSDRERAEGFHRLLSPAVAVPSTATERAEGFHRLLILVVDPTARYG